MKKAENKMATDKCGNFCFINKVGGEFVFSKDPISIDKEGFFYYSDKLPTVFTFQEWEQLLLDTNWRHYPCREMYNQLVKEFYDKYKEDWRDLMWDTNDEWYDLRWHNVGTKFRKLFWFKEWLYNPYVHDWIREDWNFFYSCSRQRGANHKMTALWVGNNRVCTFMNCSPDTPLWIRPVSLFPNKNLEWCSDNFIYVDLNNEHWH